MPVHKDTEVGFPEYVNRLCHHDLAHQDTLGWGLFGDQTVTYHLLNQRFNLVTSRENKIKVKK